MNSNFPAGDTYPHQPCQPPWHLVEIISFRDSDNSMQKTTVCAVQSYVGADLGVVAAKAHLVRRLWVRVRHDFCGCNESLECRAGTSATDVGDDWQQWVGTDLSCGTVLRL